jgi:hypothetical protein
MTHGFGPSCETPPLPISGWIATAPPRAHSPNAQACKKRQAVVIEQGVQLDTVSLDPTLDATGVAWIARVARRVHDGAGRRVGFGFIPDEPLIDGRGLVDGKSDTSNVRLREGLQAAIWISTGAPNASLQAVRVALDNLGEITELRAWRDRTMPSFNADDVQRVEVASGHRWSFTKDKDEWRATFDGRPFAPLSQEGVRSLTSAFKGLIAEEFAEPGVLMDLGSGGSIQFFLRGGRRIVLRVGARRSSGGYYAERFRGQPKSSSK